MRVRERSKVYIFVKLRLERGLNEKNERRKLVRERERGRE